MKTRKILALLVTACCLFLSGCDSLSGTTWFLVDLNGRAAGGDADISISFQDDMISGTDGCNRYSASFTAKYGKFTVNSDIASTMMACPEPVMAQAAEFVSVLKTAAAYRIDGRNLTLLDAGGNELATFTRQSNALAGTSWVATGVNNGKQAVVSIVSGSSITAAFSEDGKLNGSAGCNNYTAAYTVSGGKITIGPAASTRKACAEPAGMMEQETQFLKALETAATYRLQGTRLEFRNSDGALAVQFVKAQGDMSDGGR